MAVRDQLLRDTERFTASMASVYRVSGLERAFLSSYEYQNMFQDVAIYLVELETSVFYVAVWVGSQNCNANGKLLSTFQALLHVVHNALEFIRDPEPSHKSWIQSIVGKVKGKPSPKIRRKPLINQSGLRDAYTWFVNAVHWLLNEVTYIDRLLHTSIQTKPAGEMEAMKELFERLYLVKFNASDPSNHPPHPFVPLPGIAQVPHPYQQPGEVYPRNYSEQYIEPKYVQGITHQNIVNEPREMSPVLGVSPHLQLNKTSLQVFIN